MSTVNNDWEAYDLGNGTVKLINKETKGVLVVKKTHLKTLTAIAEQME